MRLFSKKTKSAGYLAFKFHSDCITAIQISRPAEGKPVVSRMLQSATSASTMAHSLEKLGKEAHASRYLCIHVLTAGEYQLLSVDAPNVPPEELKDAVRWRLKESLDYAIDEATIDVLDVPVDKNGPARQHSMYAIAANNQLLRERQKLFVQAKVPLKVIDIPDIAQRNISALLETAGRGLAVLSFDADGGLLTVTFSGELYLSRRIDVNLTQLTQASAEQKTVYFDRITLELQRSLDHFDRQYNFIAVSKLLLAPLGSENVGLQEYLSTNLYIPLELVNLENLLDLSQTPELREPANQQRFFLTIGAALRLESAAQ